MCIWVPVGARYPVMAADQGRSPPSWCPVFRILYRFPSALVRLTVRSGRSKDLEIIVLRHQLAVLRRQTERPAIDDNDRTLLGAIGAALPGRLRQGWIVTPETLLRWHRRRIARHWTQPSRSPGRPSTTARIRRLIVEMATSNPTWGYRRITAELHRLGHRIGASTVWRILKQHNIDPAPNRSDVTWTQFLRSQAARNLLMGHGDRLDHTRALVRDRGSQFVDSFDEIFRTEGLKILRTPVRTPVANTFAKRWIGTLRRELLDRTIVWNRRQLERLVTDYIAHYNTHRPHRSLDQQPPRPGDPDQATTTPEPPLRVVRTTRCDGLINEYRDAA